MYSQGKILDQRTGKIYTVVKRSAPTPADANGSAAPSTKPHAKNSSPQDGVPSGGAVTRQQSGKAFARSGSGTALGAKPSKTKAPSPTDGVTGAKQESSPTDEAAAQKPKAKSLVRADSGGVAGSKAKSKANAKTPSPTDGVSTAAATPTQRPAKVPSPIAADRGKLTTVTINEGVEADAEADADVPPPPPKPIGRQNAKAAAASNKNALPPIKNEPWQEDRYRMNKTKSNVEHRYGEK